MTPDKKQDDLHGVIPSPMAMVGVIEDILRKPGGWVIVVLGSAFFLAVLLIAEHYHSEWEKKQGKQPAREEILDMKK